MGIPQGYDDFMVVRDGSTLYVLHRHTSDEDYCETVKQGPLEICKGFPWERRAEIRLAGNPALYERVDNDGKPFDCGTPLREGSHLEPPRRKPQ